MALHSGDTVIFSATPVPGNERAVNETIDRIYRLGATAITPREVPIHASGHGYAEELKLMLNLTQPQYVMPVHGDHKRLHLHGRLAEAVGIAEEAVFMGENGRPLELDGRGARFGEPEQAGMIFVDGMEVGDIEDVALRDRRMLSADGIFIVVATVSEQDGRSVVPPEIMFRGVPFIDEATASWPTCATPWTPRSGARPRSTSPRSTCSRTTSTTTWPSSCTSELRRRPMILPVVVEV